MYFENIKTFDFKKYIANNEKIYAHVYEEREETLEKHSQLCVDYLKKIIKEKELENVLYNFEKNFLKDISNRGKILYREMLYHTIYLHDLGKININFQYKKMNNTIFKSAYNLNANTTNHSALSSILYINYFFKKIKEHNVSGDIKILMIFMMLNAYIISKHHGGFDSFQNFKSKMIELDGEGYKLYTEQLSIFEMNCKIPILLKKENVWGNLFKDFERVFKVLEEKEKNTSINIFIYARFIASLLLSSDYYATSHFKNQKQYIDFGEIKDIQEFYNVYKNTKIYRDIRKYEEENYGTKLDFQEVKDINIMRNEMFLDAENALLNNMDKDIFYLEAPTGSGKSNTAFNLTFKILEENNNINKIFYIYPFNTLIEQNIETLNKIFEDSPLKENITVINSIVPIKTKEKINKRINDLEISDVINQDDEDYANALLDRQFLHYPMILTTHVSSFNYLFGTSKENLFPLAQIANSVFILDEIQSYRNSIWKEIICFLKQYVELLNIKFIIMSATLPNLNKLVNSEINTVNLIKDREKYFNNPIFKNRVKLDFSLLEYKENIKEKLLEHVSNIASKSNKNILIEFINKKSAMDFYKELNSSDLKREIMLITGDDNSIERKKIIDKVRKDKNIILVATQVVEAGLDIDMDIGYKNISILDAEEQFLGRINRSCKKASGGIVYFFSLDDAAKIYKGDVRKEKNITLLSEDIREVLNNKDFQLYYDQVLNWLNKRSEGGSKGNFNVFINDVVNKLNFKEISEKMTLIDEHYKYSVFLSRKIHLENGQILDGNKVWNEYIKLLQDNKMDYAEKRVKLSRANSNLHHFIYKVKTNNFTYEKNIGDLYYIPDGEKYFEDGKFDRENFDRGIGDFI